MNELDILNKLPKNLQPIAVYRTGTNLLVVEATASGKREFDDLYALTDGKLEIFNPLLEDGWGFSQGLKVVWTPDSEQLYHYGVKGMRWGIRKKYVPHPRKKISLDGGKTSIKLPLAETSEALNDVKKVPRKKKQMSCDEDMRLVNAKNGTRSKYKNNCLYCTLAYDLRRRGYDVSAGKAADSVRDDILFTILYKGVTLYGAKSIDLGPNATPVKEYMAHASDPKKWAEGKVKIRDSVMQTLSTFPEGSNGNLSVNWEGGGGHSIAWSRENGKSVLRDTQINKTLDPEWLFSYVSPAQQTTICRLDNATPDIQTIIDNGVVEYRGQKKYKLESLEHFAFQASSK